jgi:hypothetical protein
MAVSTQPKKKLDPKVERLLQLIVEARQLRQAAISAGNPTGQQRPWVLRFLNVISHIFRSSLD